MKDVFDLVPQGTMRSNKKGRIKPVSNPEIRNLKVIGKQLLSENQDLKERLAALEEIMTSTSKKKKGT